MIDDKFILLCRTLCAILLNDTLAIVVELKRVLDVGDNDSECLCSSAM